MVQFSQTKRFLDFSIGDTAIVTESSLLEEVMLTEKTHSFVFQWKSIWYFSKGFELERLHFD